MAAVTSSPEIYPVVVPDVGKNKGPEDKITKKSLDSEDGDRNINDSPLKTFQSLDLPGPKPRTRAASGDENYSELSKTPRSAKRLSMSLGSKLTSAKKKEASIPECDMSGHSSFSDTPVKSGSVRSTKTTEAERRSYFENHVDVLEVEPHRVRCRCCNQWLKLSNNQRYSLAPWNNHRKSCTSNTPSVRRSRANSKLNDSITGDEEGVKEDDTSSRAPSVSASERTSISAFNIRRSSEDRKNILEEDEFTGEVREDSVFCTKCSKWIRLETRSQYSLRPWFLHTERVHGRQYSYPGGKSSSSPSSRVQEAERKLQLVNDAQATEFTATMVTCRLCSTEVQLNETIPYQLDNWLAHKSSCPETSPLSSAPENDSSGLTPGNRGGSPRMGDVPPGRDLALIAGSEISKDATLDNSDVSPEGASHLPLSPRTRKKRSREEYEDGGEQGTESLNPSVRARTELYVPPVEKPPNAWAWLWQPWEIFKRGFAEGMGAKGSSLNGEVEG